MFRLLSMLNLQKVAGIATNVSATNVTNTNVTGTDVTFTDILAAAGEGWLGVFIVVGVIVAMVYILNAVSKKK